MRWSFVAVVALGLVAAACAAVLMGTFRAKVRGSARGPTTRKVETVEVVVAAEPLKAMTVVDAGSIRAEKVPKAEAPEGSIHSAVRVAGKVIAVPMVEGQPFVKGCFASDGTGAQLAAALPKGMRAVSIPIPRGSGIEALLYPGCVVDVLATFKVAADSDSPKEAIATVLIQSVDVLAVGNRTIVSDPDKDVKTGELSRSRYGRPLTVTLLVNPPQAEALQLAMEHGAVSLAMRNPLDASPHPTDGTFLTELSEDLARVLRRIKRSPNPGTVHVPGSAATQPSDGQSPAIAQAPPPPTAAEPKKWITVVLRGGKAQEKSFILGEDNRRGPK